MAKTDLNQFQNKTYQIFPNANERQTNKFLIDLQYFWAFFGAPNTEQLSRLQRSGLSDHDGIVLRPCQI